MTLALLLLACRSSKPVDTASEPTDTAPPPVVREEVVSVTSDREGYADVRVQVAEGEVFQVIGTRTRGYLSTDYVYGPEGDAAFDWEDWYEGPRSLTYACFPSQYSSTMNWPVRSVDGPLTPGEWTVRIAALTPQLDYQADAELDVIVLRRRDDDLTQGTLRATVAYAGGLEEDPEVVRGTEAAVAYWTELYAARGLTLEATFTSLDTDANLPNTMTGLEALVSFGEAQSARSVVVVVGDRIGGDTLTYGEAGGIPGPYAPARTGAVFLSWLANAGADARFSDSDVLLYGETMAHEVGHYLGLFHPVEQDYRSWDALSDTEECSAWAACDTRLGSNLMYPYPVCDGRGASSCVRQTEVTDAQAGVLHRWIGVE
jgi:hypothetical protein